MKLRITKMMQKSVTRHHWISLLLLLALAAPLLAQDFGEEVWTYDIGDDDYAIDVAVDGQDYAYVLAGLGDDGEPPNYLIIQYDANGDIARTIQFDNGADGSFPKAIAVDANDNLYVTGVRANGTSNDDCLTISYTDSGDVRWERTIDNNNGWDSGNAITIDSRGDVVVGGNSARTADGRIHGSTMLISKYDEDGNMVVPPIHPYYALPQTDSVVSISTDGNGNVYALDMWNNMPKWRVYKFDPSLQYVYSVAVDSLTSEVAGDIEGNFYLASWDLESGNYDAKLIKYDTDGNLECEATYDNDPITMDRAFGIAIDEVGDIYLVGHGNNSYLTLKYDSSCSPVWPAPLIWPGVAYFSLAKAVAVDSLGDLYVTGNVGGEIIPTESQHDVATVKYTNLDAPPSIPLPDLAMTDALGPASATNGEGIFISNTVTNRGLDCDCASLAGIYLSEDWLITTEDTLLGSRQIGTLFRDEEDSHDTFVTIPDSVDYGSYYLGAVADSENVVQEMAEYNNGHKGNQISISRPSPDLVMIAASGPETAVQGQQITISDSLMNQGLDTGGPFSVELYLSTDRNITTEDFLLASREVGPLGTGQEASQETSVTIPASLDLGLYYAGVIADSHDAIAEWDETNNAMAGNAIRITLPAPDLIMTSVSGPTSAAPGDEIVVPHSISNQGAALDPYDIFWVYFYLSTDEIITTDDILLTGYGWGSAMWGGSTSSNVTIPDSVADGTYYLGAVVDATDTVSEWDETNNGMAGNVINITSPTCHASCHLY